MPSVPTYLMSRNGIWYLNYRIPTPVRNRYSIKKLFIRKSLRTTNVYEAVKLSRKYTWLIMSNKKEGSGWKKISGQVKTSGQAKKLMQLEGDQEILNDSLLIGRKIVEKYEAVQKNGTYAQQNDFWMEYSEYEYECYRYAVDKINKEQATSITLNELIEKFIKYKEFDGAWKSRTLKLQKGRLGLIRDFLEYSIGMNNPMIHLFKSDHAIMFEKEFCHYPKNCKKHFPNMDLAEVMSQIDSVQFARVDRFATNNYNEYGQLLMAVFKWAKED